MAFDEQGVSTYFLHREAALNYDQFLTQSSIDQTLDYLSAHRETLEKAQADYGVEPEIVCAIILVETRLGKLIGSRLVINTLSTLAALSDREPRETIWRENLKERATGSQKEFEIWASRRSAWAYRELKAYLQYVTTQGLEPFSIRGSFAGALGIAQFIPSSVLEYAKDGNQDGKINLFDHEDAIESIAYYLNRHGWRPSLARQKASDVLLSYNQSQYYVETILEVAERLGKSRSR
jgi:membrane-bound lytic murein transglycosylase B